MFDVRSKVSQAILQLLLTLMVIPFVVPLYTMIAGSFKGQGWGNYKAVVSVKMFPYFFRNSAFIAICTIALVYATTMMAAYGFSKLRIPKREVFFWMMMACLTLPEVVLLAPLFKMAAGAGLYNTFWAVIIPISALQVPFTVLLTRTYVDGIPDELFEAARIDGAGTIRMFWNVLIPLTKPMAVAVVVLVLINAWNSYLLPLIFLMDPSYQVVTLLPQYFQGQYNDDQTKVMAGAVLTALPEIIAYISLQRFFERGMAAGALK
ncbi:MAG: carbohydrate ABC transporter permease [Bifidobacteriaceae bacterium]|jgi:ABC-type glycerol-3-phosphate transport system permease component|nr:carbohydrate ABC transporter permease [Bifidobacteriaceae bacterium]